MTLPDNWLDEVLHDKFGKNNGAYWFHYDQAKATILSNLEQEMLAVIGEDEEYEYLNNKVELARNDKREVRNKLKTEQRTKLTALIGRLK